MRDWAIWLWCTAACHGCCGPTSDECHQDLNVDACRSACSSADPQACMIWGHYAKDPGEKVEAFRAGCTAGNGRACEALANVSPDSAEQVDALGRACIDTREGPVLVEVCLRYAHRTPSRSRKLVALEAACRGGSLEGCRQFAQNQSDPGKRAELARSVCAHNRGPDWDEVCQRAASETGDAAPD